MRYTFYMKNNNKQTNKQANKQKNPKNNKKQNKTKQNNKEMGWFVRKSVKQMTLRSNIVQFKWL